MSDPAERSVEAEPLKGGQEEVSVSNGHGCAGKLGLRKLSAWRTAAFLLSVFLCLGIVFAFSFILPCPVRPQYQRTWNVTLPAAATYDFLTVADASKDKVLDVLLLFKSTEGVNHTCAEEGLPSPCLFLLAVSGTDGASLWERPFSADLKWAQCGLGGVGDERKLCVVAHEGYLTAIDINAGAILWQRPLSPVAHSTLPVISLPDLDSDGTKDIAVLSHTPAPAKLVFLSGESGSVIASNVTVDNLSGSIIAHLQYTTSSGAQYLLLHTDSGLYAVGIWKLAAKAETKFVSKLKKDNSWEKKASESGFIPLYKSVSLLNVFKVKSESSSSSSPLLLHTDSAVMLLNTHLLAVFWTTNISNLLSPPSYGHYNKDGVLDIVLEEDLKNASKRVVIVDGQTGADLWKVHLQFHDKIPQPASILTINYFSVFMMWGDQYSHFNSTSPMDEDHATYLLHPLHSEVLLERTNPAQNIVSFKATLLERGRHACYLILTGEDATKQFTGKKEVILTKRKIKDDVSESSVLQVGGDQELDDDVSWQLAQSVKVAFHRLRFSD